MTSDDDFYIYQNAYISSIVLYTFHIIMSPPSDECPLVCGIIDTGSYELCLFLLSFCLSFIVHTNDCNNTLATPQKWFYFISDNYMILGLPACHPGGLFFAFFYGLMNLQKHDRCMLHMPNKLLTFNFTVLLIVIWAIRTRGRHHQEHNASTTNTTMTDTTTMDTTTDAATTDTTTDAATTDTTTDATTMDATMTDATTTDATTTNTTPTCQTQMMNTSTPAQPAQTNTTPAQQTPHCMTCTTPAQWMPAWWTPPQHGHWHIKIYVSLSFFLYITPVRSEIFHFLGQSAHPPSTRPTQTNTTPTWQMPHPLDKCQCKAWMPAQCTMDTSTMSASTANTGTTDTQQTHNGHWQEQQWEQWHDRQQHRQHQHDCQQMRQHNGCQNEHMTRCIFARLSTS